MNKKDLKSGIVGFIPGFRTGTKWKMIIASIYYLFALICLLGGIGLFLFLASIPFVIINLITAIRRKNKMYYIAAAVSFIVLILGCILIPTSDSVQNTISTGTATPFAETPTPVPTENITPTIKATTPTPTPNITATPISTPTPIPTPTPELTLTPTVIPTAVPTKTSDSKIVTNKLMQQAFMKAPVMNGFKTQKIGEYGYIKISKIDVSTISKEDFREFIDTKFTNDLNWLSIIFDDNTTIIMHTPIVGSYGIMRSDDLTDVGIDTVIGTVILTDNGYEYTTTEENYEYDLSH